VQPPGTGIALVRELCGKRHRQSPTQPETGNRDVAVFTGCFGGSRCVARLGDLGGAAIAVLFVAACVLFGFSGGL